MEQINPRFKYDAINHPKFDELKNKIEDFITKLSQNKTNYAIQGSDLWQRMRNFLILNDELIKKFKLTSEDIIKININNEDLLITPCIGGSEIAAVLGIGSKKYGGSEVVKSDKLIRILGLPQQIDEQSSHMLSWGHLFEPVIRRFAEVEFNTIIYEIDGSITHKRIPNFRYSPDGVGLLRLRNSSIKYGDKNHYETELDNDELKISLWEFKCPFNRIVKDQIPIHYTPQVLSGTSALDDLVECGLYIEGNYKVKPINRLCDTYYNAQIHPFSSLNGKKGSERYDGLTVHDNVIILFHTEINYYDSELEDFCTDIISDLDNCNINSKTEQIKKLDQELLNYLFMIKQRYQYKQYPLCDFGALNFELFCKMLKFVDSGKLIPYYSESYIEIINKDELYNPIKIINEFINWCTENNRFPYGMLCASLYDVSKFYLHPSPKYVDMNEKTIKQFCRNVVKDINNYRIEKQSL